MSEIRTTQLSVPDTTIDLGIGQPGLDLLPHKMLQRASEHYFAQGDSSLLQYGLEQGDGHFRLALAQFLSEGYGRPVTAAELFVTNGISQALDMICTVFTRPGDIVFVEEPTYFLAHDIFADHHLRVMGVPTDEQGLDVDQLELMLERHAPAFIYTIPAFQNPTGATLSLERRQKLTALSKAHEFLIVADEVYHLLSYTEEPPPPMGAFIDSHTVLSLGTFSKILAPGLRLGWIQSSPRLLERLINSGLMVSGGGLNPYTSGAVGSMLKLGLQQEHLARLKQVYQQRAAVLAAALQQHLPETAVFRPPTGGFFIWLQLPEGTDTTRLLKAAQPLDVGFQPGVKFSSESGFQNYLRLCFAFYEAVTLERGVQRLSQVVGA